MNKPEADYQTLEVTSVKVWANWLEKNHATCNGVWLKFFKKSSNKPTVNYQEILDEALCFGWIDGQAKPNDDQSWFVKYTPRRPKSIWSKRNIQKVERLISLGKMKSSGLAEFEKAKADGRLAKAYDSASTMQMPEDFLEELSKNKPAEEFFKSLNKTNTYAIFWRLQTVKKLETRQNRMKHILKMMAEGKKFH